MAQDLRTYLADNDDLVSARAQAGVARPSEHADRAGQQARLVRIDRRPPGMARVRPAVSGPGRAIACAWDISRRGTARIGQTSGDAAKGAQDREHLAPSRTASLKEGGFDLREIPGFQHGERDPGPGIIAMNICREPDDGAVNFSFTRLSPLDARRATYLIGVSRPTCARSSRAWEERGEPMPMACVIGTHPAYEDHGVLQACPIISSNSGNSNSSEICSMKRSNSCLAKPFRSRCRPTPRWLSRGGSCPMNGMKTDPGPPRRCTTSRVSPSSRCSRRPA